MKTLFLSLALLSTTAFAKPSDLRGPAVAEFLKQANDARSPLGQLIVQHNKDTEDGRNEHGTIAVPVTAKSIQVTAVGGEEMYNPWHYGERSDDGKLCRAGGDSVALLIALAVETGVHAAHESETRLFTISANESFSFPASPDQELSCQEQADGAKVKRAVNFSAIEEVTLQKKN